MIIDTSFLISVMKGNENHIIRLQELERKKVPLSVSVITIYELFIGVSRCNNPDKERVLVEDATEGLSVVDFNQIHAQKAGMLYGELKNSGKNIDPEDTMIAGTALTNNETVLTLNKKHFSMIPDLVIEPV